MHGAKLLVASTILIRMPSSVVVNTVKERRASSKCVGPRPAARTSCFVRAAPRGLPSSVRTSSIVAGCTSRQGRKSSGRDLEDQLSNTAKLAGQVMRVANNADAAKSHLSRQEPDLVFVMIQKMLDRNGSGDDQEIVFAGEVEHNRNDENTDQTVRLAGQIGHSPPVPRDKTRSDRMVLKVRERPAFPVLNEREDVLALVTKPIDPTQMVFTRTSSTLSQTQLALVSLGPQSRRRARRRRVRSSANTSTVTCFETHRPTAPLSRSSMRDELKADVIDKGTLDGLFDATFASRSSDEREAIKDRYATRTRVLNAADPLKAKAIDVLRHYITNILPNDLKAQVVASSRELAVQYVEKLKEARDEIVNAIEGAADILRDIEPEAAQNAGGDVAFLASALPHLDAIRALEFAAVISVDHNDLPHLKAWGAWRTRSCVLNDSRCRFFRTRSQFSL